MFLLRVVAGRYARRAGAGIRRAATPERRVFSPVFHRREIGFAEVVQREVQQRKIAVFGAGYIGLVTGACLAQLGHEVVVRDIQPERVRLLRSGEVPIHEPGLGDLIARNKERLVFTTGLEETLAGAEVAYVCVDTPPSAAGDADLSRVWSVVDSLAGAGHLRAVVVKSTVPVGTGARVRAALDRAGLGHVGYASNPEFTAEGRAVEDFLAPDRVVIGSSDAETARLIGELHAGVDGPVVVMDVESAEMSKMAANALLATKISFINEIATLCELTGGDVEMVAKAVGMDHRLGPRVPRACFSLAITRRFCAAGSAVADQRVQGRSPSTSPLRGATTSRAVSSTSSTGRAGGAVQGRSRSFPPSAAAAGLASSRTFSRIAPVAAARNALLLRIWIFPPR
ncbi:UDP-glucose/GDP-mannose dehydrogenase family protein (plasmid) [Streptomyces clavuligerus]|uniref:UDP-glucose 6-dehydrogenase n=2 Tax=Streptomyces clavuligerus TaxID=1901 RepID=D5SJ68_STRCL|nr:nucleotide sugar dehydrogenase [Streptomyces clavuligerus]EFG03961.1 UDP-glucose 6-dehydrogenase [Streptomyces clavuligerus]MBY6307541.1 UDP-glucose/GDP-mannose dehydrogenase family protein [Streptomyces clavuligerus]QCS09903.1 UDP-glucose/GDP-mannose dehydrogenase family protein [Streptomyces clavuligerus]QPJ98051.1 nucleotide sugar dehydrogenase [Streptomyces clavuligerus]